MSLLCVCVQRVSRYPLFLNAMLDYTARDSEEGLQLKGKFEHNR